MPKFAAHVTTLQATLRGRIRNLRSADRDTGASVVELAVITGAILALALALLVIITNAVNNHSANIQ